MNETGKSPDIGAVAVPSVVVATKPAVRRRGFVYFATDGELIKIGYSRTPTARRKALQSPTGKPVSLIAHFPGCMDEECTLHRVFAGLRASGREWYRDDPSIRDMIAKLERHRNYLQARRMEIEDVIFDLAPHAELPPPSIPKGREEFSQWAYREAGKWPPELQAKSFYANMELDPYCYKPPVGAMDTFIAAYTKWING